jgi:hypothetical protein
MWHSGGRSCRSTTNLSVDTNPAFPYLDMEMYWSGRGQLRFRVHLKPNQQLLYLSRGSSHTSSCYRDIESDVLGRLAKLTSATAANLGRPMHQLYPEHAEALQRAGLSSSRLPTLKQVLDCTSGSQGRSRSRSATKSPAVFVCLGFSKFWKTPIHVLLRRLRNKHNLLWLRVSMSYHSFNNLRELFLGHLKKVLLRNVDSEDPRDRPCNCDEIWPQLRTSGSVQAENENEKETSHWRTRKAMVMDKTGLRFRWANKSTILTAETGVKHESIKRKSCSKLID